MMSVPEQWTRRDRIEFMEGPMGVRIPVSIFAETGHETPVILTHGIQSHAGWFFQSAEFLADRGHPVYAFDRRGSGRSDAERGHCESFMELVDEVAVVAGRACEASGRRQVHVVGHCYGAIPAAAFACAQPSKLASLVLSTPGIHTFSDLTPRQKLSLLRGMLTGRTVRFPVPLAPDLLSDIPSYVECVKNDSLALNEATGSLYLETVRARRWIRRRMGALTIPVFMASAAADRIANNRKNAHFFQRIPSRDKRHRVYENAIHVLEFSRERDAYFDDLSEWFQAHEGVYGVDPGVQR